MINDGNLSEDSYLMTHEVGPNQQGIRLDAFLKSRYRKRSRGVLQKAIESGAITLERNQGPHVQVGKLKASSQLLPGDRVLVLSERRAEPPVDFNYKIIYEDEQLLVIDKPPNLPVHPAGKYFFNSLLIHLKTSGHREPLKAERDYFLVHRIDKETSGVLVLAKDRVSAAHLVKQFVDRKTTKYYQAIVKGTPKTEFEVNAPLRRAVGGLISLKMEVAPPNEPALSAFTAFKTLLQGPRYALIECFPKTGRQHQIRVHLAHAGHPIVGDKLYGMSEENAIRFYERKNWSAEADALLEHPRHCLHSSGIDFVHPKTRLNLSFRSTIPNDMKALLENSPGR